MMIFFSDNSIADSLGCRSCNYLFFQDADMVPVKCFAQTAKPLDLERIRHHSVEQ